MVPVGLKWRLKQLKGVSSSINGGSGTTNDAGDTIKAASSTKLC